MKISVIGSGYVGLVTGACLADVGNHVLCVDVDENKIARLQRGEIPIHEPGLDAVVARCQAAGRLQFSTRYDDAVEHAEMVFIAVGTPSDEDGSADLRHVLAAASELGRRMTRDTVVVVKSTVPVGTNDRVREVLRDELAARGTTVRAPVASNPEFLKEGFAIEDFMRPDRIIVGVERGDSATQEAFRRLYAPFNRNQDRLQFMDVRSAEFTKYAANCMLAVRISFMNELANLAERLGVDIEQVRHGIGADPRIGPHFLYAGAGFGGSCFPKDLRALIHTAQEAGEPAELMRAAQDVNARQRRVLARKIIDFFGGDARGRTVALWGLAFKANTDDVREASSIAIVDDLLQAGARVRAYDPAALDTAARALAGREGVTFVRSAPEALEGADVLAVATEWLEFRSPDFAALARTLKARALFDGRNLYDPAAVREAGLAYHGIGRVG
ncbi:UDP-glucose/GDP-mannose dehydrogenase family protein [Ramlibacter sp.]|uniref:UDP-glucose dehydrogenase family protein n=1 Tax=Ramlibacter sp. TaxID=1917967 RepID=UPI002D690FCD|nr:UDP-glucose/GDP-mannose dehydrogenase family protein [Ramlibacter sp.]HYD75500.1 UDP-glucose/GDP-mannose dehydrogenase family protein [Ramlibacter sp.]